MAGMVKCGACGRKQPDLGKRQTCAYCGTQPLPSFEYSRKSAFHPLHPKKRGPFTEDQDFVEEVKRRRVAGSP